MSDNPVNNDNRCSVLLEPVEHACLVNLYGPYNNNIRQIEDYFDVNIHCRGNRFSVVGAKPGIDLAAETLRSLYASAHHEDLSAEIVQSHIQQQMMQPSAARGKEQPDTDRRRLKTWKGVVTARSPNQSHYLNSNLAKHLSLIHI